MTKNVSIYTPMFKRKGIKKEKNRCKSGVDVIKMAEEEGFEPPRGLTRLSVFKTDPFSRTWVFLRIESNYLFDKK